MAAAANHSCDPNAITVFDGPRLSFRALRPIAKGEEIFISYIDATEPCRRRQRDLSERFYFQCRCGKCEKGTSTLEDEFIRRPADLDDDWLQARLPLDELVNGDIRTSFSKVHTVDGDSKIPKDLTLIQATAFEKLESSGKLPRKKTISTLWQALAICLRTEIWPEHRQPVPSIRQALFVKLLMHRATMFSAFRMGLKLYFDVHPVLYPSSFHPVRIVHKWTLAMLALFLAAERGSMGISESDDMNLEYGVAVLGLLREVVDNVPLSHGKDSNFARSVQLKFEEVSVDMTRGDPTRCRNIENQMEAQWGILRTIAAKVDYDSHVNLGPS